MTVTSTDLAADLGVGEDEPALIAAAGVPDDAASFLRECLDPHGEHTAPPALYWPGSDDEPRRRFGLGGPDPTA